MTSAERWASRVLQVGGILAVGLILMSILSSVISGIAFDPRAIAALGFVVLCVTPLAAVVSAGLAFWRTGDRQFTVISGVVVALLLFGLWLGRV